MDAAFLEIKFTLREFVWPHQAARQALSVPLLQTKTTELAKKKPRVGFKASKQAPCFPQHALCQISNFFFVPPKEIESQKLSKSSQDMLVAFKSHVILLHKVKNLGLQMS